ncbi:hypothetical protein RND81_10G050000 [Saponaria officinalis]|uniref:Reverse transcriptase zinc-binding domain-containing protein n=1 Tax=Saponaria officinalis TaxID=3572 RepID=A0AAW1HYF1_SAPOF
MLIGVGMFGTTGWCLSWLRQEGLNTRAKLFRFGVCDSSLCCLCEMHTETHAHLFQECQITVMVCRILRRWIELAKCSAAVRRHRCSLMQKKFMALLVNAMNYQIWYHRNKCRLEGVLDRPEVIANQIKAVVRGRVQAMIRFSIPDYDRFITCL